MAQAGSVAESIARRLASSRTWSSWTCGCRTDTGIEACREIRAARPETRVVMLTSYPDEEAVLSAIIAGASGYLLKQIRGT